MQLHKSASLCDSIAQFISISASQKYCGVFSSDITPTTDGHKKNTTPPTSRNSSVIRGVRGDRPTKTKWKDSPL
ncbi:hypothetical protein TNCV_1475311 [Trichonephila clavipes]|nr:hypothetical protein TNCV_1475311 [Trichonephila clavipes]